MITWLSSNSTQIQTIASIFDIIIAFCFGLITVILILRDKKQRTLLKAMQATNELLLLQQLPSLSVDPNPRAVIDNAKTLLYDIKNQGGDLKNLKAYYLDGEELTFESEELARGQILRISTKGKKGKV